MSKRIAALLALCVACDHPAKPEPLELEMRSYRVPAGMGQQLRSVLGNVLAGGDKPIGRASLAPNGEMVVVAPGAVQGGVAQLIKELESGPRQAPVTIEIDYWLLRSRPGAAGKDQTPEMAEMTRALGAQLPSGEHIELVEKLRLQSMTDEAAELQGRTLQVWQNAAASEGRIVADLRLTRSRESASNRVQSRVQLAPGQLLVLAESGDQPEGGLFYAVKAETK